MLAIKTAENAEWFPKMAKLKLRTAIGTKHFFSGCH